ncbi:MAG: hypothetical protein WBW88_19010 [Rhodothermales bacterium]
MFPRRLVFVVAVLTFTVVNSGARAQAPRVMSFQGLLTDDLGVPIDGTRDITLKIFDAVSAGTQKWSRTYAGVSVNDGVFNLALEAGSPLFYFVEFEDSLWIQVEVDAEVVGPRNQLTASPYAMGLSLPIYASTPESSYGLEIENTASSGGSGVKGTANAHDGVGVYGLSKSEVGSSYGVYGRSRSAIGRGVYGEATSATGSVQGVSGTSYSTEGTGVFGEVLSATGATVGVSGYVTSSAGWGVYGLASSVTGVTNGVRGIVNSPTGWAGYFGGGNGTFTRGATNDSPDLILGGSSTTDDDGRIFSDPDYPDSDIWLQTNDALVVVLDNDGGGLDADFEVRNNAQAVLFDVDESGAVSIPGTLSKGSGTFKIDHPLDPEHKYLYHSFVESPEMKNIYDGTVILDQSGSAMIELPAYFEALNRDFRY